MIGSETLTSLREHITAHMNKGKGKDRKKEILTMVKARTKTFRQKTKGFISKIKGGTPGMADTGYAWKELPDGTFELVGGTGGT